MTFVSWNFCYSNYHQFSNFIQEQRRYPKTVKIYEIRIRLWKLIIFEKSQQPAEMVLSEIT